jgi:hypothetical protein
MIIEGNLVYDIYFDCRLVQPETGSSGKTVAKVVKNNGLLIFVI